MIKMESYTGFAKVYDTFMDNIPYKKWSEYLVELLKEYNINDGLVADLGCGTGNITTELARNGYDMIGIDNSDEMLSIAMEKARNSSGKESSILYLLQDMREFELYGTVSAIVSICDSINYIVSEEDLLRVFKLVNNYLDAKGIFIFDLNTVYKYSAILADNTIAENREDCSFIWDNYYYEDEMMNEYDLTIYVKEDNNHFLRFNETHFQKAYTLETIKKLLEEAGLLYITALDAFTHNPPKDNSERIYIIAREGRQENKKYT
ncbi:methyltransferase family protein [Mobilisporobacter senegalensis]|uniref:Methyltransferase family protein n=2 Tax=Mobilisporobacter senegalensis TaxID=1329262 RepID=A0A3N1XF44_9FIRM|nr:methyltransferase family protein [Mobilisporobacter senegalensis]